MTCFRAKETTKKLVPETTQFGGLDLVEVEQKEYLPVFLFWSGARATVVTGSGKAPVQGGEWLQAYEWEKCETIPRAAMAALARLNKADQADAVRMSKFESALFMRAIEERNGGPQFFVGVHEAEKLLDFSGASHVLS